MEFKGTKGNISVVEIREGIIKGIYLRHESKSHFLATIRIEDASYEENLANAVLFSKAPEMLEMLKALLRWSAHFPQAMNDELEKAKQLINQATEI